MAAGEHRDSTEPARGHSAVEDLARAVEPERTVLLLGAGAAVPSGAPTGRQLAIDVSRELRGRVVSEDLQELSTMLEHAVGRPALVTAVRDRLKDLDPTGGMLALPEFPWNAIYTTNFDRLVEKAYRRVKQPLIVIRSNYDYAKLEQEEGTPLLKVHGCISQDTVDGHRARLVLTEDDYGEYSKYRETLFARLGADLAARDVLVIGQSLKDPHLQQHMREAARVKQDYGAPGRLLALVYEPDTDRAALWKSRGFTVGFADIDEFLNALTVSQPPERTREQDPDERLLLKPVLRTAAVDVDHAVTLPADPVRMFNGRAATYGDISAGITFGRSLGDRLDEKLRDPQVQFISILGVAGVGKTTVARQLLAGASQRGIYCWEHPYDYRLLVHEWLDVDGQLRERDQHGVLLIDNCSPFLGQINRLVARLAQQTEPRLKLLLTAPLTQWRPRMKDPALYARGASFELSRLTSNDIASLVRLAAEIPAIRQLVDPAFADLPGAEQIRRLKDRARSDMYVCLKNVFANDQLDDILLQEFAELEPGQQDVYRFVAALEAMGGRVHRQLVLRLLDIRADEVARMLEHVQGIVDEYTISERDGLYGWSTRHELIARTIAEYKYSDQEELKDLLHRVVDDLNPTVYLEMRGLREMCNSEFGIASLKNHEDQLELFEKMVRTAPAERIPRHRVIRKLLEMRRLEDAALALRHAEEAVGVDRPINRYKVRLAVLRAETTPRILTEDRLAILKSAETLALEGIEKFPSDRLAYTVYAQVGEAVAKQSGDRSVLDAAITLMSAAYDRILDPAMGEDVSRYERIRRELPRKSGRS